MAEERTSESIPLRMRGHLPNLASMCDPDFLELAWENGQILIRGLSSSKKTKKNFPCSGYFSQSSKARTQRERETSTANIRSKDGVADSTFIDPLSGLSGLTKLNHRHEKNKISSLQTGYPELLSELYEDGFDVVFEPDKNCYDKQLIDSNIVPVNKFKNFKQSDAPQLVEEIIPQQTMNSDSKLPQSCLKQSEGSIEFMRSNEKKSRIDEKRDRVNFSIFLRSPPSLLKSNQYPRAGATTRPTSSPGLGAGAADDLEGKARSVPRSGNPVEEEGKIRGRSMKPILPGSEPGKESVPDEQSEAVGYKDNLSTNMRFPSRVHGPSSSLAPKTAIKGNPGNRKSDEQMIASSSVLSRGASNCPSYTLKRRHDEDTDDLSENEAMEEPHGTTKAAPARGRKGSKRKRKSEVHNLSERRRRDKINKKMRALQELIPNCNKVDKASMLDEAIEYLRTLQLQVQMMSMGTGVYMPPNPMMFPSAMQHINARLLGGYSPIGVGNMGMRMQMGLGCTPAQQFPSSTAAALPTGITEARLNMLGFPAQVLLMSMSRSPFVPLAGRFSPQSVQTPGVSAAAAARGEIPGAAVPLSTTSMESNPTH